MPIVSDKMISIIKMVSGMNNLASDADYENLSFDVAKKTGTKEFNINTWKRIMRHWNKDKTYEIRRRTCNILAEYIGCNNWAELVEQEHEMYERCISLNLLYSSSGFISNKQMDIVTSALSVNEEIFVKYTPDREVHLRYIGNQKYLVIKSNTQLEAGDVFVSDFFIKGYSFLARNVMRGNVLMGNYISASNHVITRVGKLALKTG